MIRRLLALAPALLLFAPPPALAKRSKVPALQDASLRAEPREDAEAVLEVKKGESLLVIGKQGAWSQVMTDGGKRGWVPDAVVSAGGLEALDPDATAVAAFEADTGMAIRARPNPPRTLIVGVGGLALDVPRRVGDGVREAQQLRVISVRSEAGTKPGSPAGGLLGAAQLGGADGAEVVVAIQGAAGGALAYEIVDLKNGAVLANATTRPSTDPRAAVAELVDAIRLATSGMTSPVAPAPSPTPAPRDDGEAPHPAAPKSRGGGKKKH